MNKIVTFGDVLLRLSTQGYQRFSQANVFEVAYGGVEINVSTALSYMGISAAHITRLPDNEIGKSAEKHFKKHNVDSSGFLWGGDRMGLYYLEQGNGARSGKVVYDRIGSSFHNISPEMLDWSSVLKGATWFHFSGITPALSEGAAKACLNALEICRQNGTTISVDVNFRRNLWQYGKSASEIMPELLSYTDIAIASVYDMNEQFGIPISNKKPSEAFHDSASALSKKFPNLKKIVTSFREVPNASENYITSFLYEKEKTMVSKTYSVTDIVDRIGTGDAFAAGFIYGLMQKWTNAYSLEYAMASMLLKHSIQGDQSLSSVEEIKHIADGNETGRLIR